MGGGLPPEVARRYEDEKPHGSAGRSVVVRHSSDQECAAAVDRYRAMLVAADATFAEWTLDHIIRTWKAASESEAELSWLKAFEQRYVDVELQRGSCDGKGLVS